MKRLVVLFLLFSGIEKASAFNSGLNIELVYIYGVFIAVVLLIVGMDQMIKYVSKKLKERQKLNEQTNTE